jgi:hypothetical protein
MRYTALPNGWFTTREQTVPLVSAHAGFRLKPELASGVLADFPSALDWPNQRIAYELTFYRSGLGRLPVTVTTPAIVVSAPPEPDTWSRIFRPDLIVRPFVTPRRKMRRIRTFRAGRLTDRWREQHVKVATLIDDTGDHIAVGAVPSQGPLADYESAGPAARSKEFDLALTTQLESALDANGFIPHDVPGGLTGEQAERRDLLEFRRFLDRVTLDQAPGADADGRLRPPQLDFHEVITLCAAHGPLLRRLGFVVDLVPDGNWAAIERELGGAPDRVSVRAIPFGRAPFLVDPSPWTRCSGDFTPVPSDDSDLSATRFLRLGDPSRFRAESLDVENATLRAIGLGGTIQLRSRRRSRSTPDRETVPTLRATGIGIYRTDRARRLHERSFQRGDELAEGVDTDPTGVVLAADDVLRGFRLDVRPEGARQWLSLVRRTGELHVSDDPTPIDLGDSEGWTSDGASSDDAGELYIGEEQFRWDGWSPVAPKPSRAIDRDGRLAEQNPGELPGVPVVARYRPTPGTLVPLRYRRRYQFRARAVDIAGNSALPTDTSGAEEETPLVLFGRLDAVNSPDIVLTAPRLPGEKLQRVVLRTRRRDLDAEGVAARYLLPPRTTRIEAERHGVIDGPDGRPDPARFAELAAREAYDLSTDVLTQLDTSDPNGFLPGGPADGASRFVPLDARFVVGYLPDPLARWLQIRLPDGRSILPDGLADTGIEFGGPSWPADVQPIEFIVRESLGDVYTRWNAAARQLLVYLPKAETLDVRLSSGFARDDLATFALADWVAREVVAPMDWPESIDALQETAIGERIREGRNWVFTPWQPMSLVHAVKDPLTDPAITPVAQFTAAQRQFAQTATFLTFPARWHVKSTGRLDLLASWTEGIDRGPGTPPPRQEVVNVVAAELPITVVNTTTIGPDGVTSTSMRTEHEHGDTKHRRINYRLEATGAFLDNFVQTRTVQFVFGIDSITLDGIDLDGIALGTVSLSGPKFALQATPTVTFRREGDPTGSVDDPVAYRLTSTPGSTTATITRLGDVIPQGAQLTLRFVTNPISHRSAVANRNVFASARPAAPEVHSVLPTFGWQAPERNSNTITSSRGTAGVRVWLERPWWSSGLGEQLAVLYRTGTAQPSRSTARFVTQWGRDPVHAFGNSIAGSLTDASFPRRSQGSVELQAPGGPVVRAVPHAVHFDADRDKWYCDIDLNIGSYWPFVRLALARWQPNAIIAVDPTGTPGSPLALSPVVLADIVQVAPGRTATVSVRRAGPIGQFVTVALQGRGPIDPSTTVVRAHLERQPRTASGDVDWEEVTEPRALAQVTPAGVNLPDVQRREGTLLLAPSRPSQFRYRVVIEEYERYRTDGDSRDTYLRRVGPRLSVRTPYPRDGERLVHLDVISITALL